MVTASGVCAGDGSQCSPLMLCTDQNLPHLSPPRGWPFPSPFLWQGVDAVSTGPCCLSPSLWCSTIKSVDMVHPVSDTIGSLVDRPATKLDLSPSVLQEQTTPLSEGPVALQQAAHSGLWYRPLTVPYKVRSSLEKGSIKNEIFYFVFITLGVSRSHERARFKLCVSLWDVVSC